MNNLPLVSVIVLCYNQKQYIQNALESLNAQTYGNIQIVIIDDFSTDGSQGFLKKWCAENLKEYELILHDRNQGLCKTLNDGLEISKGKFVSVLACDDVYLPERIEKLVAFFESIDSDKVAYIYSDLYRINEKGELLYGTLLQKMSAYNKIKEGDIFLDLLQKHFTHPLGCLYKRKVLEEVGGYDESLVFEDADIHLRISQKFKVFFYKDQALTKYRVNLSNSLAKQYVNAAYQESIIKLLLKHFDHSTQARGIIIHRLNQNLQLLYSADKKRFIETIKRVYLLTGCFKKLYLISQLRVPYWMYNFLKGG